VPSFAATWAGHFWTIAPFALGAIRAPRLPPERPFYIQVPDRRLGRVRLSGKLTGPNSTERLLVVVHGLGGSAESNYARRAAHAAMHGDLACLRINLRGADLSGEDFYHAGLASDLDAVLASPVLSSFREILLLGYSLGGHVSLRYAAGTPDPRLARVAAVCSPLDLRRCAAAIDEPRRTVYREHVLRGLREMYQRSAPRLGLSVSPADARRIRTLFEWDERIVAPRHGFEGAHHYWREASVAPHLGKLRVPALLVLARHDPMVPEHTVRPALEGSAPSLDVRFVERGGHVGFPGSLSLGQDGALGLEAQLLAWLTSPRSPRPR
jgi:uncharacterized protein